MSFTTRLLCAFALLAGTASSAQAVVVGWTNWQGSQGPSLAHGQIALEDSTVDVSFNGPMMNVLTGGSYDYFREYSGYPAPYTGGEVENAPEGNRLIQLSNFGTHTITFSEAVVDPYIALISWNGQTTSFSGEIEFVSEGRGYWGDGDWAMNGAGTGFTSNGELHGVVKLKGTYTSFTFTTSAYELWHGFTVGAAGLAPTQEPVETPEPAVIGLLGLGLAGAAGLRRRRKR